MLLSDSQISMRPLCSDLLFTPVDYIFVIFLTKFLSWLVGDQLSPCSSNCISIIIPLLSFCYEGVILVLDTDLGSRPEKVAQILGTLA